MTLPLALASGAVAQRSGTAPARVGGGRPITAHALGAREAPLDFSIYERAKIAPLGVAYPAQYDLRDHNKLTPVKNQNPYGSCWSFAAMGSLESCLMPGETWDFSEDNLVWYSGFDANPVDGPYDSGGISLMAIAYLTRWDGPFTESQDPYSDGSHPAPSSMTLQKHVQDVLFVPSRPNFTSNDDIKYAVMTYGAVATDMFWSDYCYDSYANAYYYDGGSYDGGGHAVCIVGWDDAFPASNFSPQAPGNGAFLVRNSWGAGFGDGGYFWCSYYDQDMGFALNNVFSGAESASNYTRVYQHDPLGWTFASLGYASGTGWLANTFTATASEKLSAVSFYTLGPNAAYEIWAGPSLSSLTKSGSGTLTQYGYQTVDLTTPYALTAGQPFVAAVKLTIPPIGGAAVDQIAVENQQTWGNGDPYSSEASASPGQSYYGPNGTTWNDVTGLDASANVCLKAFTTVGAPPTLPAISSISPGHASAGATVVVTGSNFTTSGTLKFGGTTATTSSWTDTAIVATVPNVSGTVQVTVTTTAGTSGGYGFTVDAPPTLPAITTLIPTSGPVGATVVVTGTNFTTSGTLKFGPTTATTPSWADTAIVATVPNGVSGTVQVTVTTTTGTSNALPFTVTGDTMHPPTMSFTSEADLTKWHNHDLPVTFTVSDSGGDADVLLYSYDLAEWNELDLALYDTLVFPAESDHSWDGDSTVYCKAHDLNGDESAQQSFHVKIDTRRPTAKAPYAAVVRKGATATLRYRVNDLAPNGGTATNVKLAIKNRYGQVVKSFKLGTKSVNKTYSLRFTCRLAKGSYRFYVSGRDTAGNAATVGSNRLTVS